MPDEYSWKSLNSQPRRCSTKHFRYPPDDFLAGRIQRAFITWIPTDEALIEVVDSLKHVPLGQLIAEPPTIMWEHQGKCPCGRRSFLFSLCSKCLQAEAEEKKEDEETRVEDFAEELQESLEKVLEVPTVAGVTQLPDVLPDPPKRTGLETRSVVFITDESLREILRCREKGWQYGPGDMFSRIDDW